jgi:hypothetical protein
MASKRITVQKNTDFHEYVDFYRAGAAQNVSAWLFKIKVLDRAGAELLSIAGAADLTLPNRIWFNALQVSLAALPTSGVTWYLLAKDPDGYVSLVRSGRVVVQGGALW